MVQVNFEHFTIGTKLYACLGSQIKVYIVTGININYSVDVEGKACVKLMYNLRNVCCSTDSPGIPDSAINKIYFSSEQELLKYIVGQMH